MRTDQDRPRISGDKLEVRYAGQRVGYIVRRSEAVADIGFEYDAAWLAKDNSFPISVTMPLSAAAYDSAVVYPWFLNLLPEGETLAMVGAILHVAEADVFAMLEEMGGDLPGALDVRRPQQATTMRRPRYHWLSDAELAETIKRLPQRPMLAGEDGIHMSVAGAQEKLPVAQNKDGGIGLALDGAPTTHILKPRNTKFRAAVENEAFCLRLASAVKLPVPEATMHRVQDVDFLLVKRYDRVVEKSGVRRIHQEDFCQATGFPPALKYEWNRDYGRHGPNLKMCLDVMALTGSKAANKIRFIDYMIFNVLCGNVDAHAKNYSLLIRPGGNITMAPIYDVMNGQIYEGVTRNLAMKIARQTLGRHIYARHWDRFAKENDVSGTQVRRRVADLSKAVLDAVPVVVDEMNKSNMPGLVYKEIGGYITGNCKDMLSNLKNDLVHAPAEEAETVPDAATDDSSFTPS